MNKTEFLAALRRELSFLPKDELDDAIRYYDEYINDAGDDEEKVIAEMGTPHKVAEEFKNEYYDRKNVNDESAKHNNQISWKTVMRSVLFYPLYSKRCSHPVHPPRSVRVYRSFREAASHRVHPAC